MFNTEKVLKKRRTRIMIMMIRIMRVIEMVTMIMGEERCRLDMELSHPRLFQAFKMKT